MFFNKRRKQLKREKELEESNFGRINGWSVELDNEKIAELINPELRDQFWYSYDLVILQKSKVEELENQQFWDNMDLKFLSKYINKYAINAIILIHPELPGKIIARGLDLYEK